MNKVIDTWNTKYAKDELVFGTTPNDFLKAQSYRIQKNAKVLAVGDGEGRNGIWLAEQGFQVWSVDGASNGVRKAVSRASDMGLSQNFTGEVADLLTWTWPKSEFDAVACLHLYFMPTERSTMHRRMVESLKPDGLLILEVFHPDNVGRGCGGPSIRELCYSADDLENDFAQEKILLLEETERDIRASSFHDGGRGKVTRAVVQRHL